MKHPKIWLIPFVVSPLNYVSKVIKFHFKYGELSRTHNLNNA